MMLSGPELLLLLPGDSILAETASVHQVVVLLVVVADLLHLPVAAEVVTILHARMTAETEIVTVTTRDGTVIVLAALMTGKKAHKSTCCVLMILIYIL